MDVLRNRLLLLALRTTGSERTELNWTKMNADKVRTMYRAYMRCSTQDVIEVIVIQHAIMLEVYMCTKYIKQC